LSDDYVSLLKTAIANVDRIPAASEHVFHMQEIIDRIPTKAIAEQVKGGLEEGSMLQPRIEEIGFRVREEGYSAFVTINKTEFATTHNVLTIEGLGKAITDTVISELGSSAGAE